jgi:hypothetical protein
MKASITGRLGLLVLTGTIWCGDATAQGPGEIEWAKPISGSWHEAANWIPAQEPEGPEAIALIGQEGPFSVLLSRNTAVGAIRVMNGQATLSVNGTRLGLSPNVGVGSMNAGTVRFTSPSSTAVAGLDVLTHAMVAGPGRFSRSTAIEATMTIGPGVTFENGAGHTMESPMVVTFGDPTSIFANSGVLSPGGLASEGGVLRSLAVLSPGQVRLAGGSSLVLELTGAQVCEQLNNTAGVVTLGGKLTVLAGPGAALKTGDWYPLILGQISGEFQEVELPALPFGRRWEVLRFPGSYEILIVCVADCDGDGELTIDDFVCFQTAFGLGEPAADCDEDGSLTIDDFVCFQTAFVLGC